MKPKALLCLFLFLESFKTFASNKTLDGSPLIVLEDPSQSSAPKSEDGFQEEKQNEDSLSLKINPKQKL
ncbi:MAG: hypothetical protein IPL83_07895 [Bdellovibrionales bacterium]|nr:hypothetical protein [Bdellovibrionales bacterium]